MNSIDHHDDSDAAVRKRMRVALGGSPSPPAASPSKTEPLKGFYFHRILDNTLSWQGVVLRQFGDHVLVLTFEWLLGANSCCYLLNISDLVWNQQTKSGFFLYPDHPSFVHSFSDGMAASRKAKI